MTIAITARIVSPLPNPSAEYIAGAKRGNPQPANERKQDTAAIAELRQKNEQQNTNGLVEERTRRSVQGKSIDDIGLDALKTDNDARADQRDTLFRLTPMSLIAGRRNVGTHDVRCYPVGVCLSRPSSDKQPYRKHDSCRKHGS